MTLNGGRSVSKLNRGHQSNYYQQSASHVGTQQSTCPINASTSRSPEPHFHYSHSQESYRHSSPGPITMSNLGQDEMGGRRHPLGGMAGGPPSGGVGTGPYTAPAPPPTPPPNNLDRLLQSEEARELFNDSSCNILLCGLSRSGKSSIAEVVFHKTSPHETLYFQPTLVPEVQRIANTNLVHFTLIDFPGAALLDPQFDESLFPRTSSIILVIDAQNEPYTNEIAHCKNLFKRAWQINPRINLEVFIHKVDGDFFAVDEVRAECQRDIHDKLMSHLHEDGVSANVIFYSTSIYDHTVFEACSRVVQRLMPHAPVLEQLLDLLVANCRMEKAFLIDVLSKTFIATDSSPFDPYNYELCTDMIEVVIEISSIYGDPDSRSQSSASTSDGPKLPTGGIHVSPGSSGGASSFSFSSASSSSSSSQPSSPANGMSSNKVAPPPFVPTTTMCLIQLNTGHILYLKEIDRLLALACVIREDNFDRQYLVDHNIRVFRESMLTLFQTVANGSLANGDESRGESSHVRAS